MATRAQNFRAAEQRSQQRRPKVTRADDHGPKASRNQTKRGAKNAGIALETTTGKPSRKSTRASANHGRPDEQLQRAARGATHVPKARAMRAQVARH